MYKLTITRTRPNTNVEWFINSPSLQSWVKTYFIRTGKLTQEDPHVQHSEDGLNQTVIWFSTSRQCVDEYLASLDDPASPNHAKTAYDLANSITRSHTITEI